MNKMAENKMTENKMTENKMTENRNDLLTTCLSDKMTGNPNG